MNNPEIGQVSTKYHIIYKTRIFENEEEIFLLLFVGSLCKLGQVHQGVSVGQNKQQYLSIIQFWFFLEQFVMEDELTEILPP